VTAPAGWYPDPGGGVGLYRYWDGRAWSAATSPNPAAPPPVPALGTPPPPTTPSTPASGAAYGAGTPGAYEAFQRTQPKRRGALGWWLGAAALLVAVLVVAVVALRAIGGGEVAGPGTPGGQPTQEPCPEQAVETPSPRQQPADGRVHGGPLSFPQLGPPWEPPTAENRVPFGRDVLTQMVTVEPNYAGPGTNWVASVLVGELQAGDGFFTPQQGSKIVVRCILGKFYGDAEVDSDVKIDRATRIDNHDAWLVESQLSFDIPGLQTKGELLIVAIVATGSGAGIYYASIPDSRPELVQPARDSLKALQVDA